MLDSEIRNEYDMLRGNINRMFVCDDINELDEMYRFAKIRIERFYEYHHARIINKQITH